MSTTERFVTPEYLLELGFKHRGGDLYFFDFEKDKAQKLAFTVVFAPDYTHIDGHRTDKDATPISRREFKFRSSYLTVKRFKMLSLVNLDWSFSLIHKKNDQQ